LHLAVECGNLRNVELLVTKGADVNAAEFRQGKTALHMAVELQDKRIVDYLLQNVRRMFYNSLDVLT
jgi:NF-kappa-B inhibitor epsilon